MKLFLLMIMLAAQAVASDWDAEVRAYRVGLKGEEKVTVVCLHALPLDLRLMVLQRLPIETPYQLCQLAMFSKRMQTWADSDDQWQRFKLPYDPEVFDYLIRFRNSTIRKLFAAVFKQLHYPLTIKLQCHLNAYIHKNSQDFYVRSAIFTAQNFVEHSHKIIYVYPRRGWNLADLKDDDEEGCGEDLGRMSSESAMLDLLRYTEQFVSS